MPTRTYTIATKLDGTLKVALRPSPGLRLMLDVYASGARAVHTVTAREISRTTIVCGARSYTIRITATRGRGSFSLTFAEP